MRRTRPRLWRARLRGAAARRRPRAARGERAARQRPRPVRPAGRRRSRPSSTSWPTCASRLEFARPLLDAAATALADGRRDRAARRLRRQGRLRRRGPPGRPRRAPGPRRDRLHRGARPEPVADQGPRARPGLGQPGQAPGRGDRRADRAGDARAAAGRRGAAMEPDRRTRGPARRGARPVANGSRRRRRGPWPRLCTEIGVAGLAIPERYGGAGAGPAEIHVVMEELGRSLTPAPMLGSAVLATQALLASGDEAACARLLPALADGTAIAALAWTTPAGHWDPAELPRYDGRAPPARQLGTVTARRTTCSTAPTPTCCSCRGRQPGRHRPVRGRPGRRSGVTRTPVRHHGRRPRLAVVRLDDATGRRIGGTRPRRSPSPGTRPASRWAPSKSARPSGRSS